MSDMLASIVPVGALAGVVGWFGNALVQWMRSKDSRHATDRTADAKLEEHRDALTFQLLEAARIELGELREEVHRLRPMESHLLHFDEALRHLEALLGAETEAERILARRGAQAFLNRMRRLQEATGTLRNEAQRIGSKIALIERESNAQAQREGIEQPGNGEPSA